LHHKITDMLFKYIISVFLIGFFLLSLLGMVVRSVRSFFTGEDPNKRRTTSSSQPQQKTRKKVIREDEGEYVDYVEIK